MQFSIPATTNSSAVAADANNYPDIRLFTVGQGTSSKVPLADLMTIEQVWAVANSSNVLGKRGGFSYFSSVCWFFGKGVHDGLGGAVPMGLISNNWGVSLPHTCGPGSIHTAPQRKPSPHPTHAKQTGHAGRALG